jgi:hypothetical protein
MPIPTDKQWGRMGFNEKLGDQPIQDDLKQQMHDMAHEIDRILNGGATGPGRKWGYVVMTFPFGNHDGRCNYISNGADRKDVVVLMKEMIARFEGQPEVTGRA